MKNAASLHAKLLNIARKERIEFQLLMNRFGAEQFLARLSRSPFAKKFIFKGGSLLAYLIDTDRKTKDLDFTIKHLSHQVDEVADVIKSVLRIPLDDCLKWGEIESSPLTHPDMDYPGVRIVCHFLIGKMRGRLQMDLAIGDAQEAVPISLKRIRYKDEPLMGPDFEILSYPRELIFAEKLQIAVAKGEENTRMRDYYDLFKLLRHGLDDALLKTCLMSVFAKRETPMISKFSPDEKALSKLQKYWEAYAVKAKLPDAPGKIIEIISLVNDKLKTLK